MQFEAVSRLEVFLFLRLHPVGFAFLWFPVRVLNSVCGPVYIQFMQKRGAISLSESAGLLLLSGANYGLF